MQRMQTGLVAKLRILLAVSAGALTAGTVLSHSRGQSHAASEAAASTSAAKLAGSHPPAPASSAPTPITGNDLQKPAII
jgi:hypothetical protein